MSETKHEYPKDCTWEYLGEDDGTQWFTCLTHSDENQDWQGMGNGDTKDEEPFFPCERWLDLLGLWRGPYVDPLSKENA